MKGVVIVLTILTVSFLGCIKKPVPAKITYQGHIYDSIGGSPSPGIIISLSSCNSQTGKYYCETYEVGRATTDINGYFKIEGNKPPTTNYFAFYKNIYLAQINLTDEKYTKLYLKK